MKRFTKPFVALLQFCLLAGISSTFAYGSYLAPKASGLEIFFAIFAAITLIASVVVPIALLLTDE